MLYLFLSIVLLGLLGTLRACSQRRYRLAYALLTAVLFLAATIIY